MKKRTTPYLVGSALAASLIMAGCGGSSPSPAAPAMLSAGRAQINILWPARTTTKLVPAAANSIVVNFVTTDGKTIVATQTLVRPNSDGPGAIPGSASFVNIPQGAYNVQATAYPTATGAGDAQASAIGPVNITAGATTPINLTMATTIKTIDIEPHNVTLPATLTATALDGNGNLVLTNAWSWSDSNSEVVSMAPSGNTVSVAAVGTGTAVITATETESGVSGSTNFSVGDE